MKPQVENKARSQFNTETIVAVLKRIADEMFVTRGSRESMDDVAYDRKVSLNDSIVDLDFEAKDCGELIALFDKITNTEDVTFLFQTSRKLRMFTESGHLYDEAQRSISDQIRPHIKEKLSKITLNFSPVEQKNILNNLLLEVSKFLYNGRIEIHSAFFTPSEIVLILNNDDAINLYDMLHTDLVKK